MIKFDKIHLKFGEKEIFSGLDLEVGAGEKVVLSGRSGIGKSSLFGLVLGFIVPDSGTVYFENVPVDEKNVWDVRRKAAYVDQDSVSGTGKVSDWIRTVSEFRSNIEYGLSLEKVVEGSQMLDMKPDLFEKDISELSGGERQRVSISLALASGKNLFLLDEATSALDDRLKTRVADIFLGKKDATVISISHDPVWTSRNKAKVFDLEGMKWQQ